MSHDLESKIFELAEAQLDGEASIEQIAELEQLVSESETARGIYLEYLRDAVLLAGVAGAGPTTATTGPPLTEGAAPPLEKLDSPDALDAPMVAAPPSTERSWFWSTERWLEAAPLVMFGCLTLIIGIIAGARLFGSGSGPPEPASEVAVQPARPETELSEAAGVARLIEADGAQWLEARDGFGPGSAVAANQPMRLEAGRAEFVFANGAHVVLEGPAVFAPQTATSAVLESGKIVAHVPPMANGFTVVTPTATIFDLGTEFGVSVDGARVVEVHVFEGTIDVATRDEAGQPLHRERVVAGEAKRMPTRDARTWSAIPLRALAFPRASIPASPAKPSGPPVDFALPSRPAAEIEGVLLRETFERAQLDRRRWSIVPPLPADQIAAAGVRPPDVVAVDGAAELINGALLMTNDNFNPREHGPIRVSARFEVATPDDELRVFVRAVPRKDPSDVNPFYEGVACTFGTAFPGVGFGMGVIVTSRDYDDTLFNFVLCPQPEPGKAYACVVEDDGQKVTFSVREEGAGGWSKTVSMKTTEVLDESLENRIVFSNRGLFPGHEWRTRVSDIRIEAIDDMK